MKNQGILYSALEEVEPRESLYAEILLAVARVRQRNARVKALALGALSLACIVVLIPALQYAAQELYASGFYAYASLLFSDSAVVFSAWREFALSLIQSLPSIAVLFVLVLVGTLLWSVRKTCIHARVAFSN